MSNDKSHNISSDFNLYSSSGIPSALIDFVDELSNTKEKTSSCVTTVPSSWVSVSASANGSTQGYDDSTGCSNKEDALATTPVRAIPSSSGNLQGKETNSKIAQSQPIIVSSHQQPSLPTASGTGSVSASPSTGKVRLITTSSPGSLILTPTSSQDSSDSVRVNASPRTLMLFANKGLGSLAHAGSVEKPSMVSPSDVTIRDIRKSLVARQGISPSSSVIRKVAFTPSPTVRRDDQMPPPETPPYRAARRMSFSSNDSEDVQARTQQHMSAQPLPIDLSRCAQTDDPSSQDCICIEDKESLAESRTDGPCSNTNNSVENTNFDDIIDSSVLSPLTAYLSDAFSKPFDSTQNVHDSSSQETETVSQNKTGTFNVEPQLGFQPDNPRNASFEMPQYSQTSSYNSQPTSNETDQQVDDVFQASSSDPWLNGTNQVSSAPDINIDNLDTRNPSPKSQQSLVDEIDAYSSTWFGDQQPRLGTYSPLVPPRSSPSFDTPYSATFSGNQSSSLYGNTPQGAYYNQSFATPGYSRDVTGTQTQRNATINRAYNYQQSDSYQLESFQQNVNPLSNYGYDQMNNSGYQQQYSGNINQGRPVDRGQISNQGYLQGQTPDGSNTRQNMPYRSTPMYPTQYSVSNPVFASPTSQTICYLSTSCGSTTAKQTATPSALATGQQDYRCNTVQSGGASYNQQRSYLPPAYYGGGDSKCFPMKPQNTNFQQPELRARPGAVQMNSSLINQSQGGISGRGNFDANLQRSLIQGLTGSNQRQTYRDVMKALGMNLKPPRLAPPPLSRISQQSNSYQFSNFSSSIVSQQQQNNCYNQQNYNQFSRTPSQNQSQQYQLSNQNLNWNQPYGSNSMYNSQQENLYNNTNIGMDISSNRTRIGSSGSADYYQTNYARGRNYNQSQNTGNWSNGNYTGYDSQQSSQQTGQRSPFSSDASFDGTNKLLGLAAVAEALERKKLREQQGLLNQGNMNNNSASTQNTSDLGSLFLDTPSVQQDTGYNNKAYQSGRGFQSPQYSSNIDSKSTQSSAQPYGGFSGTFNTNPDTGLVRNANQREGSDQQLQPLTDRRLGYRDSVSSVDSLLSAPQCGDSLMRSPDQNIPTNIRGHLMMYSDQFKAYMDQKRPSQVKSIDASFVNVADASSEIQIAPSDGSYSSRTSTPIPNVESTSATDQQALQNYQEEKCSKTPEKTAQPQTTVANDSCYTSPEAESLTGLKKSVTVYPACTIPGDPSMNHGKRESAKPLKPRHYILKSAKIGNFSVTPSGNGRVKLLFSRAILIYEFPILTLSLDGDYIVDVVKNNATPYGCIEIPFNIISGMKSLPEDKGTQFLLLEVNEPPKVYIGAKHNPGSGGGSRATTYNKRHQLDVTNGEVYRHPYHILELGEFCAYRIIRSLVEFDKRFDTLLQCPLIKDDDKVLCSSSKKVPGRIPDRKPCTCAEACHHTYCSCAQDLELCGLMCKCIRMNYICQNPVLQLLQNDISLVGAKFDKCLMDNFAKVDNINVFMERRMFFACCNLYRALRGCVPGKFPCPGAPKCSKMYTYSWCEDKLHDEGIFPRNHCVECKKCASFDSMHCRRCGHCYLPTPTQLICPCLVVTSADLTGSDYSTYTYTTSQESVTGSGSGKGSAMIEMSMADTAYSQDSTAETDAPVHVTEAASMGTSCTTYTTMSTSTRGSRCTIPVHPDLQPTMDALYSLYGSPQITAAAEATPGPPKSPELGSDVPVGTSPVGSGSRSASPPLHSAESSPDCYPSRNSSGLSDGHMDERFDVSDRGSGLEDSPSSEKSHHSTDSGCQISFALSQFIPKPQPKVTGNIAIRCVEDKPIIPAADLDAIAASVTEPEVAKSEGSEPEMADLCVKRSCASPINNGIKIKIKRSCSPSTEGGQELFQVQHEEFLNQGQQDEETGASGSKETIPEECQSSPKVEHDDCEPGGKDRQVIATGVSDYEGFMFDGILINKTKYYQPKTRGYALRSKAKSDTPNVEEVPDLQTGLDLSLNHQLCQPPKKRSPRRIDTKKLWDLAKKRSEYLPQEGESMRIGTTVSESVINSQLSEKADRSPVFLPQTL